MLALSLGFLISGTFYQARAETIQWYSYENGLPKAKKEKKKIFLHFYTDWCKFCDIMNGDTFKSKPVVAYLNKNFIPVKVNSEKQRNIALEYKVRGVPSNWFINDTGEVIGNRPGYITSDDMILFLKFIHTESYKKMTLNNFKESQKQ